jgi:hypothetical protein
LHHAPAGVQYQVPQVPVTKELLQRFRHPDPDQAEDDIRRANRLLREVVQDPQEGIERLIDQAKGNVAGLTTETCQLVGRKGNKQQIMRLVRRSAGMLATANLGAAAATLQQHAWQATPELLRHAAEWFEDAGHSIDALPWVSLIAGATVIVEASEAIRSVRSASIEGPTDLGQAPQGNVLRAPVPDPNDIDSIEQTLDTENQDVSIPEPEIPDPGRILDWLAEEAEELEQEPNPTQPAQQAQSAWPPAPGP